MGSRPSYEMLQNRVAELEEKLSRHEDLVASEKKLQESKQWYQTLFEQANDAIFIESESDAIVDVNARACDLLGYTPEELVGMTVADIQAPEVRGRTGAIIKEELARHGGRTFEAVNLHKDGTRIPVEVSTTRIGGGEFVLAIVRDIRDRKAAQKALSEAYRIIEKSPAAAFLWENREGWPVRFVTRNVVAIFGYSAEEFLSGDVDYAKVIHPDDLDRVAAEVKRFSVELGRAEFVHAPYRIITKDGDTRWVEDKTTVRRNREGAITGYQGIVEDISVRKKAEEALMVSEEKFAKAFHTSPDAIVITGLADGRIIEVNDGFVRISGYQREEVIGKSTTELELWADPEDLQKYVAAVRAGGETRDLEFAFKVKSGEVRTGLVSGDIIQIDQQPCLLGTIRDITETRMLEREVLKVEKLESLGVLAGGIAHDFNNFLTGIIGNISLAKLDPQPEKGIYSYLDEIQRAAARAKNLTHQLLTFSKGGEPVKQTSNLTNLIEDAANFALRGSNVRCEFSFQPGLFLAEVDEGQVAQVIHNLILNADQAMPAGGIVSIRGENEALAPNNMFALDAGDYVKISVQDHGTGIKKEYLKKIFDPYFSTKQKGSGLGLAVAFSVIDQHNGSISVESDADSGTTFTIFLPAAYEVNTRRENSVVELVSGHGRRLLVMDDEDFIRKLSSQMLGKMGYAVEVAGDGEETIDKYKQALDSGEPFDAVILDLTIPGAMGGKEAVKHLQQLDPNVKAIVSSGYSNDPVMASYARYGFRLAIRKPYRIEEMSAALKKVLEI